jgi:glycosyltransferase involved in cell wall biosynthesis
MAGKPRILYLARNCPYGESFGGQLRTLHVARHLRQCGDFEMALMLLSAPAESDLARTRSEFPLVAAWQMEQVPIRGLRNRLHHELDPYFLNTEGWRLAEEDVSTLAGMLPRYDVIWVHNLAVGNGARIKTWPRSVLDIDDLRADYYRSALRYAPTWNERLWARRQVILWKRREAIIFRRFDVVVVCSDRDRAHLGHPDRTYVIPNGFELPAAKPERAPVNPPRIGFIGLFRYPPNLEGVRWFIAEVWPKIKQARPDARLRLVGAGADPEFARSGPDIEVLGWVENPSAEISTWSLMVVPIRVGGGTRIKIAEGFGRRCPVVSTSMGAFGYDVQSGRELLLADGPDDFAARCLSILSDPQLGDGLVDRAWERFCKEWTWDAMAPRVAAAVEGCLRRSGKMPHSSSTCELR